MTEDELIAAVRKQTPADNLAPVATPTVISAVEAEVGHPMPRFLRRLYAEVSNGGFGIDGWECASLSPLPIMDRGCTMWTLVDFRTPDGRIWVWDGNECCRKLCPTTITSVREYFAEGIAGRLDGASPLHSQLIRESCEH